MFDSFNVYDQLESLTERSPDLLIKAIKQIKTSIKIISIVANNNRYTCFFLTDVKIVKTKKKGVKNGWRLHSTK